MRSHVRSLVIISALDRQAADQVTIREVLIPFPRAIQKVAVTFATDHLGEKITVVVHARQGVVVYRAFIVQKSLGGNIWVVVDRTSL